MLGTPHVLNFLHILQYMVLIERDSPQADIVWPLLEDFTEKAVLMNDANRIENFRRQSIDYISEAIRSGSISSLFKSVSSGNTCTLY